MYFDPYRWLDQCVNMIAQQFGSNRVSYDQESYEWFMVYGFPLPEFWLQSSTNLLVLLPPAGNIDTCPPDRFYVSQGLRTVSGLMTGHYYEGDGSFNDRASYGWARISIHIESWCPSADVVSGHNLLHVLDIIYDDLDKWAKQAEGVL
jgi:hypothetical protein